MSYRALIKGSEHLPHIMAWRNLLFSLWAVRPGKGLEPRKRKTGTPGAECLVFLSRGPADNQQNKKSNKNLGFGFRGPSFSFGWF